MNIENIKHRISILEGRHKYKHDVVEALEAEKAPSHIIAQLKIEKLALKDEINTLKTSLGQ
tara:strand:- start:603 stop:785 length:183 start_codon:yes stop_codon:yes gene_type:complete